MCSRISFELRAFGYAADGGPGLSDVGGFGGEGPNGDADHPSSVKSGRGEVSLAGLVDGLRPCFGMGIERFAREAIGFVADADGLERDGGDDAPVGGGGDHGGQGLGVGEVAAETGLQA